MKSFSNGFNRCIVASVATPNGVLLYRSSCHTWHDDKSVTRSFPDWVTCGTCSTEQETVAEALGLPEGVGEYVVWADFAAALGAADTDALAKRSEQLRAELAEIERRIAAADSPPQSEESRKAMATT